VSNLSKLQIPPFRYFPTHLLEKEGPRQWARLRILQACERLKIPQELWPKGFPIALPGEYEQQYRWHETYRLPSFRLLYESEAEWRNRAREEFEKHCIEFLEFWRVQIDRQLTRGELTKIRPIRDTTPLELRYDWVARRICLREPYKKLATKGYSEDRIKRSVQRILKEADLRA
jgi:hypothetical protein